MTILVLREAFGVALADADMVIDVGVVSSRYDDVAVVVVDGYGV